MNTIKKEVGLPVKPFDDDKTKYVKMTFNSTYVLLMTTGTITFIEALRTEIPEVRHIMNIETVISIIAAYFYSVFIQEVKDSEDKNLPLDFAKINRIRYNDWMITTPFMILGLCLALSYNSGIKLDLTTFITLIILDIGMIGLGYLGEIGIIDRKKAYITSFICLFLLFGLIAYKFLRTKYNLANIVVFLAFFIIWSIYGLVNDLDEKTKNVIFNHLDSLAKCFIGIFFWAYFTKIIVL
jgi:bacteriorhodopsin